MARALGANAAVGGAFETTYGTPLPAGTNVYRRLSFVSGNLGAESGLIESDLLGQGRAPNDPIPDVVNNDGDVVVPVDTRLFGFWLRALFGAPDTVSVDGGARYRHTFSSGAPVLPSMCFERQHPEVPNYETDYGMRAGRMQINQQRTGLLNATIGLMGKGTTTPSSTTNAGTFREVPSVDRFAMRAGQIDRDGVILGGVVSHNFTYSNGLQKVETIQPDGEVEDIDPGMPSFSAGISVVFASNDLLLAAIAGTPIALRFGWRRDGESLFFRAPRVFLPRPKRTISGPAGIQADFQVQGAASPGMPLLLADYRVATATY